MGSEMMEPTKVRRFFFTGTDTDVGKTYVASLAVREISHSGQSVAVYKPVASGCRIAGEEDRRVLGDTIGEGGRISGDAISLWEASGRRGELGSVCPQLFLAPLAPSTAAMAEGCRVDESLLIDGLASVVDGAAVVVVEGAGGLLSPLSERMLNSDLAAKLECELVIVAANRLGVIHQVLATVLAAKALGLPVAGIVLNTVSEVADDSVRTNGATIASFTSVPVLAEIAYGADSTGVDWLSLASPEKKTPSLAQAWL